jgi:hemerythrin-like metal-binding protein
MEHMSGRVGFESVKGNGTTFWLEFPLSDNSDIVVWSDELSVGVDVIDRDHQEIIRLINELSPNNKDNETIDRVMKKVVDYTKYHFNREEIIMEVVDYPDLINHKLTHKKFIQEMDELNHKLKDSKTGKNRRVLRTFLYEWYYSHITEVDQDISQYAKGKDIIINEAIHGKSL